MVPATLPRGSGLPIVLEINVLLLFLWNIGESGVLKGLRSILCVLDSPRHKFPRAVLSRRIKSSTARCHHSCQLHPFKGARGGRGERTYLAIVQYQ